MKKFKHRLKRRYSTDNLSAEWSKYDDRLIEYAGTGDVNKLRATLSKKGISPVKWSREGNTALHVTCALGHVECLDAILEQDPDLNVVDKTGASPLHVAADFGSYGCIERLLQQQANISSCDDCKMTALHRTARRGHVECVDLLVKHGASVNAKDKDGRTPLLLAVQAGHFEVVKYLVDNGANTNSTDVTQKTALIYASLIGLKDCVEILLKRGAKPYMTDTSGHTAINYAHRNGFHEIVDLIKGGPQVASWDLDEGGGGEGEEEKEKADSVSQNSELVASFSADEISLASQQGAVEDTVSNHLSPTQSSPTSQEKDSSFSLSSKTSSKQSTQQSTRAAETIKELEEENDLLNQELEKLRVEFHNAQQKMKRMENDVTNKESENHTQVKENGFLPGDDSEERIRDLELEVDDLQVKLKKEVQSRLKLQEEAEVLQAQLAACQTEDVEADSNDMMFNDDDEDLDLPGVDQNLENVRRKVSGNGLERLQEQINNLKLENNHLKEELNNNVKEAISLEPSIPLALYQQLKETLSEEIDALKEELEAANTKNEQMAEYKEKLEELEERLNEETLNLSQVTALEEQITMLQNQLMEADIEHNKTIAIYRLHLLSAVKGNLDDEVSSALQYLLQLRSSDEFC